MHPSPHPECLPRPTELAHALLAGRLRSGDTAIDATVGNGHDTAFLASQVGPTGRVYGFDLQPQAIATARLRLDSAGLADRAVLLTCCHTRMTETIPDPFAGQIRAIMFNLGYLPGGDKTAATETETSLSAVGTASRLLAPGALMTIVAYPGHTGGAEEAAAIGGWAASLDQEKFSVAEYRFLNQIHHPPRLILVERR